MSEPRTKISEIKNALKQLDQKYEDLGAIGNDLRNQLTDAIREYIRETNILGRIKWNLHRHNNNLSLWVRAFDDPEAKKFQEIANEGYHYTYDLDDETGAAVRCDDDEMKIEFGKPSQLVKFVQIYGVKLDLSRLENEREKLQQELIALNGTIALLENR